MGGTAAAGINQVMLAFATAIPPAVGRPRCRQTTTAQRKHRRMWHSGVEITQASITDPNRPNSAVLCATTHAHITANID